ncbi:MAG: acyl-CoA dehydrogenase family protein [Armatimonadota bacterium]|nr:acyl-CoA dehydrogenase family protein [Armatimonadota bacterium]MDR7402523.1 acyl-CoA dehydrogenase family protein [Armatimonadota bacterium]MDR7403699.1 acyl-CoA dehydrogenase family protein [Armatimonadota bacterium]MDR7436088.1 acyl-CoA dehydrogenase family protein [Armatimonadota bacterium]MDR7471967.1 acyl-CoA dehydrogenase family protein [Armatimonadota bacterium]
MDFTLADHQLAAQRLVREFAQTEVAPRIRDLDRAQRFDRSVLDAMARLGILGLCIPERYGGAGMDYISLGLACEELEYVDTSLRVILSVHLALNSLTLLTWGTEEQRRRFLVPQARGEKIAAYGLTEPAAGSDAVGIQATAVRDGRHYVLTGEKTWMSLADVADHFLVFAWTDPARQRQRDHTGISAFLVTREMRGVSTSTIHGKLGIRAGNTGSLVLEEVRVPEDHRIGEEGEGFRIAMFALDQGRYTVAAGATGLIRACLDASVRYARQRQAFGRPIGEHQLVKEMIARMARDYEVSRLLYLRAGWMKNQGLRNTRETSLAKWYATVASEQAASDAVEIHGAYGYADEYPVERFYRNAKGAVIYEGTREIHTLLQADYALGYREDRPLRVSLPPWPFPDR